MTKLVISIINYSTADLTCAALQSVLDDLGDRDASVIVVDNASPDGSADEIEAWIRQADDPRLRLIRSATNTGFSGGHNQSFTAEGNASHYIVLNSDATIRCGFFDAILAAAEARPDVGLTAPRLEDPDGTPQRSCFRFHGIASELLRGAATGPLTKLLSRYAVALTVDPEPEEIEWVSFACVLLRGDMVRDIGPMDEGYFLYFEDAEYALRARRAGWGIQYVPAARVVHFRGGSGPVKKLTEAKKRLPSYYWRSRTRFLRQAYGRAGPLLGNLAWILGRLLAQTRRLAGRRPYSVIENEWYDMWTGFSTPLRPDMEPRE